MLSTLNIKNFAIIDDIQIEFKDGVLPSSGINDNLDINIESKTGKDGVYRLSSDIYAYFLMVY